MNKPDIPSFTPQEAIMINNRIVVGPMDGDSVVIKQLIPSDAPLYFRLVESDRSHLSQHGDETAKNYLTINAVEDSIVNPSNPQKYRFGIWDGDQMVGSNNLTLVGNNRAKLGSWVGRDHIGNAFAGRARTLLIDFAFNSLGVKEVFCRIVVGNNPSKRSVEKSGFELVEEKDGLWIYSFKKTK